MTNYRPTRAQDMESYRPTKCPDMSYYKPTEDMSKYRPASVKESWQDLAETRAREGRARTLGPPSRDPSLTRCSPVCSILVVK